KNKFEMEKMPSEDKLDQFFSGSISGLGGGLGNLGSEYVGKGPKPLDVSRVESKAAAKTVKKEYLDLLKEAGAAKEEDEKTSGQDLSNDWKIFKEAVNKEIYKIDAICIDADKRTVLARETFCKNDGTLEKALDAFDYVKTPNNELKEILNEGDVPIYTGFEQVIEATEQMQKGDTTIKNILRG
ncbi:hypothetical protein KY312_00785, partial [Candidatus Woesearchaeota archaeon]|nr:hypothetical protein [Candidatus Woesearchaeota archaeon]